jgi:hypothetical protein
MKLNKDKDTLILENAYSQVAARVARNGMVGAMPNGLQNAASDMVDNSSPHSVNDSITSHKPVPESEIGDPNWLVAQLAFALAVATHGKKKKVDIYTVRDIAKHMDTAKRYARFLIDKGIEIPKMIKDATQKKDRTNELKYPVISPF